MRSALRHFTSLVALSFIFDVVAGCQRVADASTGWGDLEGRTRPACVDAVSLFKQGIGKAHGSPDENAAFAFLFDTPETVLIADCAKVVAPALAPCREYAVGTDSAIQCADRYMPKQLRGFFAIRCLQAQGFKLRDDMSAAEAQRAMMDNVDGTKSKAWLNCFAFAPADARQAR